MDGEQAAAQAAGQEGQDEEARRLSAALNRAQGMADTLRRRLDEANARLAGAQRESMRWQAAAHAVQRETSFQMEALGARLAEHEKFLRDLADWVVDDPGRDLLYTPPWYERMQELLDGEWAAVTSKSVAGKGRVEGD